MLGRDGDALSRRSWHSRSIAPRRGAEDARLAEDHPRLWPLSRLAVAPRLYRRKFSPIAVCARPAWQRLQMPGMSAEFSRQEAESGIARPCAICRASEILRSLSIFIDGRFVVRRANTEAETGKGADALDRRPQLAPGAHREVVGNFSGLEPDALQESTARCCVHRSDGDT